MLSSQINVYCLVTPSHHSLFTDWFLRTLPADCKPVPYFIDASAEVFAQGNWHLVVAHKFELLEQAFDNEAEDQVFIMSDVDIRFYQPFASDIRMKMDGLDVLFQHNRPSLPSTVEHLCTGFMAIRNNLRARAFFQSAHARLMACDRPETGDQNACIDVLQKQPRHLRFGFLPDSYWSPGSERGRWQPGLPLCPPDGLILHHANHTVGIVNKVLQLQVIEEQQDGRREEPLATAGLAG